MRISDWSSDVCSSDLVAWHFPHLSLLVQKLYVPKSPLWLSTSSLAERECILSEEGVQQGDPLGPFLFSMGLQPALEQAQQALDDMQSIGCVLAYLDDEIGRSSCRERGCQYV